jgi:hypothetical protein
MVLTFPIHCFRMHMCSTCINSRRCYRAVYYRGSGGGSTRPYPVNMLELTTNVHTLLQMKDELERDDSRANEEYKEDIQVQTHWAVVQHFFSGGGGVLQYNYRIPYPPSTNTTSS